MMKTLKGIAMALLLLNGVGAIFGGWSLMTDPSGSDLQMPVTFLEHSPFKDFLIPGIVLFIFNGVLSLVTLIWTANQWKHYSWLILFQGAILSGWIVVQTLMIKQYSYLQLIYGSFGVALFLIGLYLRKNHYH